MARKSGRSVERAGLSGYAETASALTMRALARIAISRGHTQTSLAQMLMTQSSNIRRHFEGKTRKGTVEFYVGKLGRNEVERKLIREYLSIVDGRIDVESARQTLINDLRARELSLRDGALPELVAAIEALNDATLLSGLKVYLQTTLEERLSVVTSSPTVDALMLSFVGRKLGLAFAVFAQAIREQVNVDAFLAPDRTPAEDALWLLWAHLQMPDSPFSDDDREAIVATAVGRLLQRGIDPAPMLRYVDRLRERTTPADASALVGSSKQNAKPYERTESMKPSRNRT